MSHFKTTDPGSSTLAAIQARQVALESQLKEDSRVVAARFVETFGPEHGWPEDDVKEVLYALGLERWAK